MLHQVDSGRSKETDIVRTLNRPNSKGVRRYLDGSWLGGVNKRGLADRGSKCAQSRNRVIASKSNRCASFFDGAENPQRLTRVVHDEQRRVRHNRVGNVEFLEVSEFSPVSSTSSAVVASSSCFSFVAPMIGDVTPFVEIDLRDDNDFVALSVFEQGRAQPARRFLRSRRSTGVSFPACRNSSFQCKASKFYASVTKLRAQHVHLRLRFASIIRRESQRCSSNSDTSKTSYPWARSWRANVPSPSMRVPVNVPS